MRKTKRNFKEALGRARTDERRQGWKTVGMTNMAVLAALGVAVINPITESAWAEWGDAATGSLDLPSGAKIDLNSYKEVQSTVTLTMDAGGTNESLNASAAATNPDEAGKVIRRTATVGLGNTNGYVVNIRGNTNLTGTNSANTIPSVSSASTLGQMSDSWGWAGAVGDAVVDCNPASMTFRGMSATDQQLDSGGAITGNATKRVTMCFGARVTGNKVADTYSNTVTLSVVAQPGKTATFGGKTTMQEITPAICKAADINDTAYLKDARDGKSYWITKLLDGNCWMSQNLDFNISTSNVTTATSDVTSNWTSSSTYPARATVTSVTTGSTTNTETYSWDLGDYVIIDPTATTACSNNNTGLSACTGQFIAVGSRTPSADPNFYQKNGATYNATEYDAHYLAGNYYQWNAATAGTGGTITNANASGSICPKNWKLPSANNDAAKGTFGYMLTQYGVQRKANIAAGAVASPVNGNNYDIALSPLFFVQGGNVYPDYQQLSDASQYGYYWSSRTYSSTSDAYFLRLSATGVILPSGYGLYRYLGFSLRCLVPTT